MNRTATKPDQDKSRPSINRRTLKVEIDRRKDDLRQLAYALGLRSYGKVAY